MSKKVSKNNEDNRETVTKSFSLSKEAAALVEERAAFERRTQSEIVEYALNKTYVPQNKTGVKK